MDIFWILVIVFVFAVVFAIASAVGNNKLTAETRQRIQSKYKLDEFYLSPEDRSLVGVSFDEHKIVLGAGNSDTSYDFAQIAAVEVVENGATVSQSNRGSQLFGAAIGGFAFGAAGAVVGGLSGSSRSRIRLRGISLKVTVDDRVRPVYSICFLRSTDKNGLDPDGFAAKIARETVDRIHAHILNAMRHSHAGASALPVAFTADELHKLWDLKQSGILTESEFAQQKDRLLGLPGQAENETASVTSLFPPTSSPAISGVTNDLERHAS